MTEAAYAGDRLPAAGTLRHSFITRTHEGTGEECRKGVLLGTLREEDSELRFRPNSKQFAGGENLVGILVTGCDWQELQMTMEKLARHVKYRHL